VSAIVHCYRRRNRLPQRSIPVFPETVPAYYLSDHNMYLIPYGFHGILLICHGRCFLRRIRAGIPVTGRILAEDLQDELLAHALLLQEYGPHLGRPTVDTLNGSRHTNMKELRFGWKGEIWRVAFAFDPGRRAILLAAGNKTGVDQRRFYRKLLTVADQRLDKYLRESALGHCPRMTGENHGKKS